MAHAVVNDPQARFMEQCTQGRKVRNIARTGFSVAQARTNNTDPNLANATAIKAQTEYKSFFVAPCDCKVVRIYVNGTPYVDMASSGTTYVQVYKAVIGASDTALLTDNTASGIQVGEATLGSATVLDTAIDGTLSSTAGVVNLLEGQHVYAKIVVSNHNVDARGYISLCMEWTPTD